MREARIHVRHVRDLLKSVEPIDSYNGAGIFYFSVYFNINIYFCHPFCISPVFLHPTLPRHKVAYYPQFSEFSYHTPRPILIYDVEELCTLMLHLSLGVRVIGDEKKDYGYKD